MTTNNNYEEILILMID